jgi:hypothetical protein
VTAGDGSSRPHRSRRLEGGVGSVLGRLRVELAGDGGADGLGPDLGPLGLIWVGRALLIARFQGSLSPPPGHGVAGAPDSGSCLVLAAASRPLLGSEDWISGCVLLIYLTVRGLVSDTILSGLLRGLFLAVLCCHLGARSRTPERRLWKVDCTGVLTASGVAVVMAHSFGHAGGEGLASGAPGVGGASARSAPRSCVGSSARG